MTPAQADAVVSALLGMARANWFDFQRDPQLCKDYFAALKAKRFKYVPDRVSCGEPDCWSLMRDMLRRYPAPMFVLGDCEDFACAYAAWLASQCFEGVYIGLVPGVRIAHAICGVEQPGKKVRVIDPSRWYGMRPTHYRNVLWRKVSAK